MMGNLKWTLQQLLVEKYVIKLLTWWKMRWIYSISAIFHHQTRSLELHTIFGNLLFSRGNALIFFNFLHVFFREVLNYSSIETTSAKVLDGIDIQVIVYICFSLLLTWAAKVSKLLGRVLNQSVEYIHCWWSWGQWDKDKQKWIGAVGKVTLPWWHFKLNNNWWFLGLL